MREFGASRTTVREVLSLLVDEGQIERRRGQGTSRVESFFPFDMTIPHSQEQWATYRRLVGNMTPRVLHRGWTDAPPPVARRLSDVEPGDPCLVIEYVFERDGTALAVTTNYLRESEGRLIEQVPFDVDYYSLLDRAGVSAAEQTATFQARHADRGMAEVLELDQGDPVLAYEQSIVDIDGDVFNTAFGTLRASVRITNRG